MNSLVAAVWLLSATQAQVVIEATYYDKHVVAGSGFVRHPDFESNYGGSQINNLVLPTLGPDMKPQFNPAPQRRLSIASNESFSTWYNEAPDVSVAIEGQITLTKKPNGFYEYNSGGNFFPIDNQGFGNEIQGRNFGARVSFPNASNQVALPLAVI